MWANVTLLLYLELKQVLKTLIWFQRQIFLTENNLPFAL